MSRAEMDMPRGQADKGHTTLLSAGTIKGDEVCNLKDETLGTIEELMLDTHDGKIRYAVLAAGGFLGMGERLFAIPWSALTLDGPQHRFTLDVDKERLKNAPGFDKDAWPNWSDSTWSAGVDSYYGATRPGPSLSR